MNQVKFFEFLNAEMGGEALDLLETTINGFLAANEVELVDIKLKIYDDALSNKHFIAIVIYKTIEDEEGD